MKRKVEAVICKMKLKYIKRIFIFVLFIILIPKDYVLDSSKSEFFFETATSKSIAEKTSEGSSKSCAQIKKYLDEFSKFFIDPYIRWHKNITNGVRNKDIEGKLTRTIVYIGNNGTHGLGDMFRGLLFAYVAAVFSDRLLLIAWNNPFPLNFALENARNVNLTYDKNLFPDRVLPSGKSDVLILDKEIHKMIDIKYFLGNQTKIILRSEPRVAIGDLYRLSNKFKNSKASIALQKIASKSEIYPEEIFPLIFKSMFKMSSSLRNLVIFNQNLDRFADINKKFISVHVRLGVELGENDKRFTHTFSHRSFQSIADCIAAKAYRVSKSQNIRPPKFYLSTDSPKFRELFAQSIKNIDDQALTMYGEWSLKHSREMKNFSKSDLRAWMNTFLDIYFLSKGTAMVRSKSGFPDLAIWMGGIKNIFWYNIVQECPTIESTAHGEEKA